MKLIIVRHGETRWNKENKLQGQADNLLSKNGLKQAKLLAERLRNQNIDTIYSSMLKRSIKTAKEIKRFHYNSKLIKDKNLNELSWSIWEGLTWDYIKMKYKVLYEKREKNKFNFKVPKGESYKILKGRIKKLLGRIFKQNKNKDILIVGRLNVNRIIIGTLLRWSKEKMLSKKLSNTLIAVITIKSNEIKMQLIGLKSL